MDIELEGGSAIAFILILIFIALLLFGLVGKFVTPVDAMGEPEWLTPSRWTAYMLQRAARKEAAKLVEDARRIQAILENDTPDPVQAMLVAQDIYADYQTGSSATAAARTALIAAAEATVRATVGEIPRDEAIAAFQTALDRIKALGMVASPQPVSTPTPTATSLYHPFVTQP